MLLLLYCSFLEIYNETITDLLNPSATNLQIREDTHGCFVEYLTETEVLNGELGASYSEGFCCENSGVACMGQGRIAYCMGSQTACLPTCHKLHAQVGMLCICCPTFEDSQRQENCLPVGCG